VTVIYRKVVRDLWGNKTRTGLVVLSTAIGLFAVGMVIGLSNLMTGRMTVEWQTRQSAHILLSLSTGVLDDDTVAALAHTPGVYDIEPLVYATLRWKRPGESEWRNSNLIARRDYRRQQQDIVSLTAGDWPQDHTWAMERQTAAAFDLSLSDEIIVKNDQVERRVKITGIVRDLSTEPPLFGGDATFFVTPQTLRDLAGLDGYNQLSIRLPQFDRNEAQTVADRLKERLKKIGVSINTPFIHDPQRHFFQDQLDAVILIMGVLGVLSLALSAFLVVNTINAVLAQQAPQIGIMKAVGATTGQVLRVYLMMAFIYGLFAVVLAVPLAGLAAFALARTLLDWMNISLSVFQIVPAAAVVQLIVGLLVPLLAALGPVLAGVRITVHEAMASYGLGVDFGSGRLDKYLRKIRWLPRPAALSLRNTFRRTGRVALALGTLVVAGVMFMMVMSASNSLDRTLDRLFTTYSFDVIIQFDTLQRFDRAEPVARAVPDVVSSEMWMTQSVVFDLGGNRQRAVEFYALPPDSSLFQPVITAGRWLVTGDDRAMVVNEKIAQEEDLKVGDRVNVDLGVKGESTWEIVGLLVDINNRQRTVFVPRDALSRLLDKPGRGSILWIKTQEHTIAAQSEVEKQLRAAFEANALNVSSSTTAVANKAQFYSQFNVVIDLLLAMAVLAGIVGSLGLMGTQSINVLERSREIGVMRAIGASSRAIIGIFVLEGVTLGLLSAVIAIPVSYPASQPFSSLLGDLLFNLPLSFQYSVSGAFIWLVVISVLSGLASLWPAVRAARLSVRDSLAYE
jgi:putative ABC transport system permease protein